MSGFATMKDVKEDPEENDETNEYYVGGANGRGGGSGMNVVAPKKDKGKEDVYKRMIEAAKNDAKEKPLQSDEDVIVVTLYRNGFTIGNGPFRQRGVAENDELLDSLSKGICPPELLKEGQPQDVKLEDKSKEDYKPPAYQAFSGAGNAIGSTQLAVNQSDIISNAGESNPPIVDEKEKTIRVQIRYPKGKKQVAKFNQQHTVNDLIRVIRASGHVAEEFVLQDVKKRTIPSSSFPDTISAAGLANAVVMVITSFEMN